MGPIPGEPENSAVTYLRAGNSVVLNCSGKFGGTAVMMQPPYDFKRASSLDSGLSKY
ncbi:hypothetical protein D3C72_2099720 [compost metagenome]